ncbi:MAG TPA: T9SS type A sorting domain-containing protein [Bacteroidia bacterium]|nr:T9SS type A sorting domain-containing protein [Bacteroidia bacterium]
MKIYKIILIAFLICFHNKLEAQNTFKKFIDGGYFCSVQINHFGNNYYLGTDATYPHVIKLNLLGDLVSEIDYSISTWGCGFINNSFLLLKDSTIVISGPEINNPGGFGFFISEFDTNGQVIWKNHYYDISGAGFYGLYPAFHNGYLFTGISYAIDYQPIIMEVDSNGNLMHSFQINNRSGAAKFALQVDDHSIIAGINTDSTGASITRIDTSGTVLWAKSYFRPSAEFHSMVDNNDGTITLTGSTDTIFNFQGGLFSSASPLFLMKVDTSGNIIWAKTFGDTTLPFLSLTSSIKAAADGGYIIAATIITASNKKDLLLIKTDMNGDTLWTRTHGYSSSNEYAFDVDITDDGGYISAGYTDAWMGGFQYGGYYLIKTDSLGHTSTLCQEYNLPVPINTIFPDDSNITIITLTNIINQNTSYVMDSIAPPPISLDGCFLTNVNQLQSPADNNIVSYPNPTQGIVTISTSNAPKAKDYITVYDSVGKIVLQRPYKQEKQEMDLSHLSKGLYTIKVVQEGKVSVSKVVVE